MDRKVRVSVFRASLEVSLEGLRTVQKFKIWNNGGVGGKECTGHTIRRKSAWRRRNEQRNNEDRRADEGRSAGRAGGRSGPAQSSRRTRGLPTTVQTAIVARKTDTGQQPTAVERLHDRQRHTRGRHPHEARRQEPVLTCGCGFSAASQQRGRRHQRSTWPTRRNLQRL